MNVTAVHELSYWLHRYRRTWRGTVVTSVANPLLILAAVGLGLGLLVDQRDAASLHSVPYLKFLMPGMLAAAMMQTATIESSGPVQQSVAAGGHYRAATATPLEPVALYDGHLLFVGFRLLTSATLFTAVGTALGAVDPARAPALVPAATLTGLAFAAPVMAWAVTVNRRATVNAAYQFVIMPLYMFSGTFFPIGQQPGILRAALAVTPLWHGTELCRGLALATITWTDGIGHVAYLVLLAGLGFGIGHRTFRRRLHT